MAMLRISPIAKRLLDFPFGLLSATAVALCPNFVSFADFPFGWLH